MPSEGCGHMYGWCHAWNVSWLAHLYDSVEQCCTKFTPTNQDPAGVPSTNMEGRVRTGSRIKNQTAHSSPGYGFGLHLAREQSFLVSGGRNNSSTLVLWWPAHFTAVVHGSSQLLNGHHMIQTMLCASYPILTSGAINRGVTVIVDSQ